MTVHGTVRDVTKVAKYQHLNEIAARTGGTFKPFQADLMNEGSFKEAMKGCSVVFHTASPFPDTIRNPSKEGECSDKMVAASKLES